MIEAGCWREGVVESRRGNMQMITTRPKTADKEQSRRQVQREKNQRAIALIQSWIDQGDVDEQRESFEALKQGLNAHHSSGRQIFP